MALGEAGGPLILAAITINGMTLDIPAGFEVVVEPGGAMRITPVRQPQQLRQEDNRPTLPTAFEPPKRLGRPPGVKDSKPRKPALPPPTATQAQILNIGLEMKITELLQERGPTHSRGVSWGLFGARTTISQRKILYYTLDRMVAMKKLKVFKRSPTAQRLFSLPK